MNFETVKQEANVAAWLTWKNLVTRARDQSFHGMQASCNTPESLSLVPYAPEYSMAIKVEHVGQF